MEDYIVSTNLGDICFSLFGFRSVEDRVCLSPLIATNPLAYTGARIDAT